MSTMQAARTAVVSPKAAQAEVASGRAVLVDVREPDEHAALRIPGAVLVPLSGFDPGRLRALGSKRVILHCKGGRRSMDALRLAGSLEAEGMELFSMEGGIEAWKAAGLPVASSRGGARISVMRQVQLVIGSGVLAGTIAGYAADPLFLVIPAFLGAGLVFAGASGTCGLAVVMGRMPWNRNAAGCAT